MCNVPTENLFIYMMSVKINSFYFAYTWIIKLIHSKIYISKFPRKSKRIV